MLLSTPDRERTLRDAHPPVTTSIGVATDGPGDGQEGRVVEGAGDQLIGITGRVPSGCSAGPASGDRMGPWLASGQGYATWSLYVRAAPRLLASSRAVRRLIAARRHLVGLEDHAMVLARRCAGP